ncbi:MAG: hypothetical protein ACE5KZ_10595 [Candidatus Scalinduaceae bacterium]
MRSVTQPVGDLGADEEATIEVFERVSPSVAYITNKRFQRDYFSFNVMERYHKELVRAFCGMIWGI